MPITFFEQVTVNGCAGCRLVWLNNFNLDLYPPPPNANRLAAQYKIEDIMDIDVRRRKRHNELILAFKPVTDETDDRTDKMPHQHQSQNNDDSLEENADDEMERAKNGESDQPKLPPLIPELSRPNGLRVLRLKFPTPADTVKVLDFLLNARLFERKHYWQRKWTHLFVPIRKTRLVLPKWRRFELKHWLEADLLRGWKQQKW